MTHFGAKQVRVCAHREVMEYYLLTQDPYYLLTDKENLRIADRKNKYSAICQASLKLFIFMVKSSFAQNIIYFVHKMNVMDLIFKI